MTMIPMLLLKVKQRKITLDDLVLCYTNKSLPWRVRARVINCYRRQVMRWLSWPQT